MKLPGYALLYVLGVMTFALLVISAMYLKTSLSADLAFKIVRSHENLNTLTGSHTIIDSTLSSSLWVDTTITGEGGKAASIKTLPWGVYAVSLSTAQKWNDSLRQSILWGARPNNFSIALSRNDVLSYSPNNQIGRGVYLKNKRVRLSEAQATAIKRVTPEPLEKLKETPPTALSFALSFHEPLDTLVPEDLPINLNRSFFYSPVAVHSPRPLYVTGNYSGPIIISSDSSVTLAKSAQVQSLIIKAPSVYVEDSTVGSFQIFAQDTVFVGEHAMLKYPSAICSDGTEAETPRVILSSNSVLEGELRMVVSFQNQDESCVVVQDSCLIRGGVYTNASVLLKGNVIGQLYAHSVLSVINEAVFGHRIDGQIISQEQLNKRIAVGLDHSKSLIPIGFEK